MNESPPGTDSLRDGLQRILEPVLSTRRPADALATSLAPLSDPEQRFILRWAGIIARTNAELAYQFAEVSAYTLPRVGVNQAEGWIVNAMDIYDSRGLYPAVEALRNVDAYLKASVADARAARFDSVAGVLRHYLHGLHGRALQLKGGDSCFTDTQTVHLPEVIARLANAEHNFHLYKAMATHLWAQAWYGTFRKPTGGVSIFALDRYFDEPERALRLFSLLETVRLDACLARDLPGLARDMGALTNEQLEQKLPEAWAPWITALESEHSTVADTYSALMALYPIIDDLPEPNSYQGEIRPEDVQAVMSARQQQDKSDFQRHIRELARQSGLDDEELEVASTEGTSRLTLETTDGEGEGDQFELSLDGEPMQIPSDLQQVIESILQDHGELPEDYTDFSSSSQSGDSADSDVEPQAPEEPPMWTYDEWDYRRQHYRKRWCELREVDLKPDDAAFVDATLVKYAGTVQQIRRSFEAMRGETRIVRRQKDGDDIDFDAIIEAVVDAKRGEELDDGLFTRLARTERDMAVVFMVDVSGSTKGWINDAERESLVLLCEALETLGDSYSIYGFSGTTRKRCELLPVKRFDDNYDKSVRARIAGMRPRDYTRMGVIIRHLTELLLKREARTRLLITLSDGKPDDYDGYGGEYGIEDTRKALVEAKYRGVHPFCITIDSEAHDYLPRMYGEVNYAFVREVRQLPLKVSDIYRRLTS